ncbi:MAG: glycerol-3-phosphate acyltransferase [Bacteroidetes bacterium]|nr:glycerol-3-phosphate acyltransferase [Bacteroidota bacterium]
MIIILCFLAGYLVGSIPTAYIIVRWKAGADIREQGSKNVGAFNAFDVTKSRKTGILVGVLDAIKGLTITFAAGYIIDGTFWTQSMALSGAIIGHNYPVWLRFHGGKGLATAAGGSFAIGIGYTIAWCVTWFVLYKITKDILKANVAAIILAPFIILILPFSCIDIFMFNDISATDYRYLSFIISGILLISHLDTVKNLLKNEKSVIF